MRRGIITLLAWWGLSGLAAPVRAQEADYVISHYDLIFKLSAGSADAEVELDITYEVRSGAKYDGFKYTGDFEPVEVSATDELGNPLPAGVRREREYEVYWRFPPVQRGSQRVIVRFRLREVLEGTREGGNELEAPWAGVFRVPVRRGAYTIVFPPGFAPQMQGRAARQYTRRSFGGQELLTFTQEPLQQQRLSVRFRPGLVDWRRRSQGGPLAIWPIVALFAVGLGGLGALLAYRGGGWGDSFSSGGCGGGGCGGGCGGGGCGGGCGG